ncbi:MAG: SRPBCC family protein [Myxococcota bacterium]
MAIEIVETLQVDAPADRVWRFVVDPERVVGCMPGAVLDEVVDECNFLGSVKVKVGAITASYAGRVRFTEVDEAKRTLRMTAEGRETGGGTAKGVISLRVNGLPGGGSELVTEANVDITGRIMQVGRGMIQGVSHQLFKQFASSAKQQLETDAAGAPATQEQTPVRILPVLFEAFRAAVASFFKKLFGRATG